MSNHLVGENSPYLLQHSENPVDWYPWSEAAFKIAKTEDKPIFLSIGYAACHWCHVMAHESFEDPETAELMNRICVNIKVDREERPDIDSIYMNAVVAMTGQGGWPMSLFLTPDCKPFFGGTYFPPRPRYGMPSFKDVLLAIDNAWKTDRQRLLNTGQELLNHLQQDATFIASGDELDPQTLEEAALRLIDTYDWQDGGWGKAPKFPQPMAIEFLIRRAYQGDTRAPEVIQHVLDAMARGGMYDVIGGGFSRYSTDNHWLVPHFEKMLYDNVQLARVYLHAALLFQDHPAASDFYRRIATQTLDFIIRELMNYSPDDRYSHGGIYSSLDADSDGEEGKFYLWTADEIQHAIHSAPNAQNGDVDFFVDAYGIADTGNFEGKIVLQRQLDDLLLARKYNLTVNGVIQRLERLHLSLLAARNQRIHPATDDKVLVSWNGLALAVFAEAARFLGRAEYLEIARVNANFLIENLYIDGRLLRSWRAGKAQHSAFLEDYANLILGLLELYQSDPDNNWYQTAQALAVDMVENFSDPKGGFYDTRQDQDDIIFRPKDLQDNATPSGNSQAVLALLKIYSYTGQTEWFESAKNTLGSILSGAKRYPTAFAQWLNAADVILSDNKEVVILGDPLDPNRKEFIDVLWQTYRPDMLAAISDVPAAPDSPPLLKDRDLLNQRATAYVCHQFVCLSPTNSSEQFADQLMPTRK